MQKGISQEGLHCLNNMLSYCVVLLAAYILLMPFVPSIEMMLPVHAQEPAAAAGSRFSSSIPNVRPNTLIIPNIGVDTPILEGSTAATMNEGIWHRPKSSNPEQGGNMVLVGHRFMYTAGPHTFYFLPNLKQGDIIKLYWNNKEYTYTVTSTITVTPDKSAIEKNTEEAQLTLYTCTPLWNPTHRFVVRAKPI